MSTQITTGKVRFSYCNLFTPRAVQEGATPKYSVTLLIPKSDKATMQKIKAAMDEAIGLKNLLGYHHMNEDWTNEGGWLACDMRRYLNEEVIALLPDELVAAIKPRKFGEEEDKLWLFSEMEVFGDHDWTENDHDRGFQFEYFKDRRNRIKVDEDGDASWWWERSPYGSNSDYFCGVYSNGYAGIVGAHDASGVCFGFYI